MSAPELLRMGSFKFEDGTRQILLMSDPKHDFFHTFFFDGPTVTRRIVTAPEREQYFQEATTSGKTPRAVLRLVQMMQKENSLSNKPYELTPTTKRLLKQAAKQLKEQIR